MKVGILTYHRSHNYGALLQAVATRVLLERMGHEVHYVDYWPEYHKRMYKFFSFRNWLKAGKRNKVNMLISLFTNVGKLKKNRIRVFNHFISKYISPFCLLSNRPCDYDVILYGSDQIWRKQLHNNLFNPVYFGENNFTAKKHIAWAASMGSLDLNSNDIDDLRRWLSNFDSIAVREKSLCTLVGSLGFECKTILDPTLLFSIEEWCSILPEANIPLVNVPYILYYPLYRGFDMDEIEKFAREKGLKVVEISGSIKDDIKNEFLTISPAAMISLIKNAEYVFTSSFHGVAFSIICKKQFFCNFQKNADRAKSLLDDLGLGDRFVSFGLDKENMLPPINYDLVNSKLHVLQKESNNFLKRYLCL